MTPTPPIIAIDPGGRNTGIVVRTAHDELLAWRLTRRQDNGRMPDGRYLSQVRKACTDCLTAAGIDYRNRDGYLVGVEAVAYWPEDLAKLRASGKRPRAQWGLYGTAMVLGGILTRWPGAVVVRSGRGAAKLEGWAYPEQIRPPVGGSGDDQLKDVRAAWDHAIETERVWKQQTRGRPM